MLLSNERLRIVITTDTAAFITCFNSKEYSDVQCFLVQFNVVQCAVKLGLAQFCDMLYIEVECRAVQCSKVMCFAVKHNTIQWGVVANGYHGLPSDSNWLFPLMMIYLVTLHTFVGLKLLYIIYSIVMPRIN